MENKVGPIESEFAEAEQKLRSALLDLFRQVQLVPDVKVRKIHSHDYAEDGETFVLMLDLEDWTTMIVTARPGEPLSVTVHDVGERPGQEDLEGL